MIQKEFNLNADAVYRLSIAGLAEPVNVAFGAERRRETYEIHVGDPASYAVGPGAAAGLAPNSNGFPGFNPQQAGTWNQTSYAAYVDVEAQLTEAWSVGVAGRYEDFSEFGNTFNGKIASRYAFTPDFAVRASYSTGFRAPTPGQLNSTSTSQGLDTVTLQLFTSGRLSPLTRWRRSWAPSPCNRGVQDLHRRPGVAQRPRLLGLGGRLPDRRQQALLDLGLDHRHPGDPRPTGGSWRLGRLGVHLGELVHQRLRHPHPRPSMWSAATPASWAPDGSI